MPLTVFFHIIKRLHESRWPPLCVSVKFECMAGKYIRLIPCEFLKKKRICPFCQVTFNFLWRDYGFMENHTAAALHTRSCRANQWFAIKANSAGGISSHFLITPSHSQIRGNPAEETSSTDDTQLE